MKKKFLSSARIQKRSAQAKRKKGRIKKMNKDLLPGRCFFAAANGADGFKSYFDRIFSSETLDGVFILKGGPGTGKSTLLFEIAKRFERPNIQVEVFLCSSDPDSLDGVLITHQGKSICVLDGTAPHTREASLPGAVDVITDLGKCFDNVRLREQKSEILRLQKKKSLAYKEAYFYLHLFGIFGEKIKAETKARLNKEAAKAFAYKNFQIALKEKNPSDFAPRPIRAFCRAGTVCLDSYKKITEEAYKIYGDETECGVLLSEVLSALTAQGHGGYYAPSPFMEDLTDGLIFNSFKTAILRASDEKEAHFSASDFYREQSPEEKETVEKYRAEAGRLLDAARESLSRASEAHFALEKIYTPAVDFDRLRSIKEALFGEIASLLSLAEIS